MRLLAITVLTCMMGCHQQGVVETEPAEIYIGQPESEAVALLDANANDISGGVGILIGWYKGEAPLRAHWYETRDKTCVQVVTIEDENGIYHVNSITLGEEGIGYVGKF